jgi:peptidoglycan/xylan/chitin deacetylase (PgdA/CDA1 family)
MKRRIQRRQSMRLARDLVCGIVALVHLSSISMAIEPRTGTRLERAEIGGVVPRPELMRGPRGRSRLAITFDAGGEADGFSALIAALDGANVRSTFFLTGKWVLKYPEFVRALVSRGHEVGNHTWSHSDLTQLDDAEVRTELDRAGALLAQYIGRSPRPLWRAPFGAADARVIQIANTLGYYSVHWTIDSLDSVAPPKSRRFLVDRFTHQTNAQLDGAIVLMHVGEPATAEALPEILRVLQRRGFAIVTISRLLATGASP